MFTEKSKQFLSCIIDLYENLSLNCFQILFYLIKQKIFNVTQLFLPSYLSISLYILSLNYSITIYVCTISQIMIES